MIPWLFADPTQASNALDPSLLAGNHRYVIFISGLNIDNEGGTNEAVASFKNVAPLVTSALGSGTQEFYFSYSCERLSNYGCTGPAWTHLADGSLNFQDPRYALEATWEPLTDQAAVLSSLVSIITSSDPQAEIDIAGYSLGGVVAYTWAATEDISHIHKIATIDSPLGGMVSSVLETQNILSQPAATELTDAPTIEAWLGAVARVDVTDVENYNDLIVSDEVDPNESADAWNLGVSGSGLQPLVTGVPPQPGVQAPQRLIEEPNEIPQSDLISVGPNGNIVGLSNFCPESWSILGGPGNYLMTNHETILGGGGIFGTGIGTCTDAYTGSGSPLWLLAAQLAVDGPLWSAQHAAAANNRPRSP